MMWWQLNKGFLLWKKGTSLETPWKPTPWLSTWGDTSAMQKWQQVTFPLGLPPFAQAFAKYCSYHCNQARASGSNHCQAVLMSAPERRAVRNFQPPHPGTSFPGTENISQLIKNWHLRSRTKRSNWEGTDPLRKWRHSHHLWLFYASLGGDKNRTLPPPPFFYVMWWKYHHKTHYFECQLRKEVPLGAHHLSINIYILCISRILYQILKDKLQTKGNGLD